MAAHSVPQILCLIGPTGTGKSSLALQIAERAGAEIVNCDSRQVYADFPCITAQPSDRDRSRCAHHLYGFLPTEEAIDAGRFIALARPVLEDIHSRGRLPLLVGGTGLYLKALIYGLAPIPEIPSEIRERIEAECKELGPEALHRRLQEVDPESADRLHFRDRQRIARALEVVAATGKSLTWWLRTYPCDQPRYSALKVGLWTDLEDLTPLLKARIGRMLDRGAMQEVEAAWKGCSDEHAPGWSGIGCWELLQVFLGRWSQAEAESVWVKNTRAYAKRQLTWFKKEQDVQWVQPGDVPGFFNSRLWEKVCGLMTE
ncbi:tRNA (adenosine(37)-N6)-dimethylallyltransferase MiaA [Desulfovermiculus halophilus]|jgi:tRNA dimethylallyltransferase|uniref:tRNA (adenosine(37)-N6)-dimethylallyltransferase MiaA n=1 Tax=Desulfovermiculus halophilus TaxID=339722 RepID=UPI000482D8F7|nr:tRNA (adenosine(37)-N6)-dimethylallyltransferase MiaA [Desulfovermiculus halophilus]